MSKALVAWSLASALALLARPLAAQTSPTNTTQQFQIRGCQGAVNFADTLDPPSGKLIVHTSGPDFYVWQTTTAALGTLLGNVTGLGAALAQPQVSAGVVDLWRFDNNGNDTAPANRTIAFSSVTNNAGTCGAAAVGNVQFETAFNGPAGLGQAFEPANPTAPTTPPNLGKCSLFFGTPGGTSIAFNGTFSVEVWVKWKGAACTAGAAGPVCPNAGDWPILESCSAASTDNCLNLVLRSFPACGAGASPVGAATPYFGFFGDDVCGGDVSDGKWHHLAFVSYGSGSKAIFVDGAPASGANIGTAAAFTGTPTTTFIGGNPNTALFNANQFANGDIDSLRIYSRALDNVTVDRHACGQDVFIGTGTLAGGTLKARLACINFPGYTLPGAPPGVACGGSNAPCNPFMPGGIPVNYGLYNWLWEFIPPGAGSNPIRLIDPASRGQDNIVNLAFEEQTSSEEVNLVQDPNTGTVTNPTLGVDLRQRTMTIPPNPFMISPFNQTQLSYQIPTWFCDTPNTQYVFGIQSCGAGNCVTPLVVPSPQPIQVPPSITFSGLNPNTRYAVNAESFYVDPLPNGNQSSIGLSAPTPSTAAATLAWPPNPPSVLTTVGNTSVQMNLNLTATGLVPPNPSYTSISVQASNDNAATFATVSGFQNASVSNPRTVTGLAQSSKYIFRSQNQNLDGILTAPGANTLTNVAGDQFRVTQPLTPSNFNGTPQAGTSGITCPKTQIVWSWNSVPIGSNQLPSASGLPTAYLLTDNLGVPISPGVQDPACTGCQTTTSFVQSGLAAGSTHQGKVFAFDGGAPGAPGPNGIRYSNATGISSVQTAIGVILPVTGVTPVSQIGSVQWQWIPPQNLCPNDTYDVFDAVTGLHAPFVAPTTGNPFNNLPTTNPVTFTEGPLGPNQQVAIQVMASDLLNGVTLESSPLSASVTGYAQAFPPTGILFTGISTGGIVVMWSGNGNPSYTRYELSMSTFNLFASNVSTPIPLSANFTQTTANLTGLQNGTTYYIRVRGFNGQAADASGGVPTSFVSGAVMTLFNAPAVTGQALSNTSLQWTWPSIGVSSPSVYQIIQNPPGGIQLTLAPPFVFPGNLTFTAVGLLTNTQFGLQVLALNGQGLASPSPFVNVYTLAVAPTIPANPIVGVTSTTISYQWNAGAGPVNPPGTFYEVDIATNPNFSTVITTVTPPATAVTVAGLFPLTTYFAEVRAYNGDLIPAGPLGPQTYAVIGSTRTDGDPRVAQSSTPATAYQVAGNAAGQWHFDESTGTVSLDVSGNNDSALLTCVFNGCVSTPTWTSGPPGLGSAVSLSGQTSSFVLVKDAAQFQFPGAITLEAWVNPATLSEVDGAGIIAKGPFNGEDFYLDVFTQAGLKKYRFSGCQGGGGAAFSSQAIVPGQWTHVAATYSGGTNSIFINGAPSGSAPCGARFGGGAETLADVSIGSRRSQTLAFDLGFSGAIDEVRIINGLYSAGQIQLDYQGAFTSTMTIGTNNPLKIAVPPNAFGGPATIYSSNDPLNHPLKVSVPELMSGLAAGPTRQLLIPGMLFEIVPIVNGAQFTGPLGSTVSVLVPFTTDANGLLTNLSVPIAATTLKAYTLNTATGNWEYLPTVVDTIAQNVIFQTPHFSVFGIFGFNTTGNTTTETRVFPVPWKRGTGGIYDAPSLAFVNLPSVGTVKIFTLAGQKVVELPFTAANTGTVLWNGLNLFGRPASSGIYFALIRTPDGSSRVLKFAIER